MKNVTAMLIAILALGSASAVTAGGLDATVCDNNEVLDENGNCVVPVALPVSSAGSAGSGLAIAGGVAAAIAVVAIASSGSNGSPSTTD